MSGESIKRKTQGEDHRNKSVSCVHRHKPGPAGTPFLFQSNSSPSTTLILTTPSPPHPPSLQIPPLPLLGTRNWRVWDARYLACCYTPISLSSQAECTNPQDADGNICRKSCFPPSFVSRAIATTALRIVGRFLMLFFSTFHCFHSGK